MGRGSDPRFDGVEARREETSYDARILIVPSLGETRLEEKETSGIEQNEEMEDDRPRIGTIQDLLSSSSSRLGSENEKKEKVGKQPGLTFFSLLLLPPPPFSFSLLAPSLPLVRFSKRAQSFGSNIQAPKEE